MCLNSLVPEVIRSPKVYDVVVIGSGAGGGAVVQVLTGKGIEVALMEAGPMLNPEKDYKEHMLPHHVDHRGAGEGGAHYFGRQPWGFFRAPNGAWDLEGEPYTVAPGSEFRWFRSRILGGRTNHYGRISLRFADYDFLPYTMDGLGTDWPITYDDLAPYYDKAESFIGVTGSIEGIRSAPDGIFQPCPPPKAHEHLIKQACSRMNIPCIPMRRAVITKPLNGRPACHYCGQCGRGCITASNYASSQVQILPALKTGKLKIFDQAMAREILSDENGRVTAVSYIDKKTRTERQIRCRVVVLAASACESARLLLNSRSSRFPAGLANNSGVVGRFLMDTVGLGVQRIRPGPGGHAPLRHGRLQRRPRLLAVVGVGQEEQGFPPWVPHRNRRRLRNAGRRQLPGSGRPNRRIRPAAQGPGPQGIRSLRGVRRPGRDDPQQPELL